MTYSYGESSTQILSGACPELRVVFNVAIKLGLVDITILESIRVKAKQNRYFEIGKSKVKWPEGKHNSTPSEAIDATPYVNGKASFDHKHCIHLAGIILAVGVMLGIKIRWGGNWDMDGEVMTDQKFQDLVHYEVVR